MPATQNAGEKKPPINSASTLPGGFQSESEFYMLPQISTTAMTMNSNDLLEVVNAARVKAGESEVRRNDFTARCRDELSDDHYETFVVKNQNGTETEVLNLTIDQCMLVSMRESKSVRRTVVEKLKAIGPTRPDPAALSRMEILKLAMESEQARIQAEEERDKAIATKHLIGSRREATAMATASRATVEANKLRDLLGASTRHASVRAVQNITKKDYAWLPMRKWCQREEIAATDVVDPLYGNVKAWPAGAWMDCHGVDIKALFGVEAE